MMMIWPGMGSRQESRTEAHTLQLAPKLADPDSADDMRCLEFEAVAD